MGQGLMALESHIPLQHFITKVMPFYLICTPIALRAGSLLSGILSVLLMVPSMLPPWVPPQQKWPCLWMGPGHGGNQWMRSKAPSTSTAAHKYNRFQVLLQVSLCRSRGTKIEVKRPESTTGGSVCFCMNYCTVVVLLYRLNSANKTGPPYSLPRLCKLIFPPTLTLTFH